MDRVARAIERWGEVAPELDTSGMAVAARIGVLQQHLQERMESSLAPYGLSPQAYSVLAVLLSHGAPGHRLTPTELRASTLLTSGGVSNILRRLESSGLVRRRPDPEDGRGTVVALTAAGRKLARRAVEDVMAGESHAIESLRPDERVTLAQLLAALLDGLERPAADSGGP